MKGTSFKNAVLGTQDTLSMQNCIGWVERQDTEDCNKENIERAVPSHFKSVKICRETWIHLAYGCHWPLRIHNKGQFMEGICCPTKNWCHERQADAAKTVKKNSFFSESASSHSVSLGHWTILLSSVLLSGPYTEPTRRNSPLLSPVSETYHLNSFTLLLSLSTVSNKGIPLILRVQPALLWSCTS